MKKVKVRGWVRKSERSGGGWWRGSVDWYGMLCLFFFFKQKTAYEIGTGDWSSDVCSSDLGIRHLSLIGSIMSLFAHRRHIEPRGPHNSQAPPTWAIELDHCARAVPSDRKSVV